VERETPSDGRQFFRDFVTTLRRVAGKDEPLPYYPQRLWFAALATADAKDIHRSIRARNAAGDDDYFGRQHTYTPGNGDRSGPASAVPQVDMCKVPPNAHDRYRRNYGEKSNAAAAAAATR
jgi:hypothetical protein